MRYLNVGIMALGLLLLATIGALASDVDEVQFGNGSTVDGLVHIDRGTTDSMRFKDGDCTTTTLWQLVNAAGTVATHAMGIHTGTAWRDFISTGTGAVVERSFGTTGTFNRSTGPNSPPTWQTLTAAMVTGTANRLLYLNGSGVGAEQAFPTSGQLYQGVGATTVPAWVAQSTILHDSFGGLTATNSHTQYTPYSLYTAVGDVIVGTGVGTAAKQTLATFLTTIGKASASGLASLNSSSLVVQNPANAQETPAAGKIPLYDSSAKIPFAGMYTADTVLDGDTTHCTTGEAVYEMILGSASLFPLLDGTRALTGPWTFPYETYMSEITAPNGEVKITTDTAKTGYAVTIGGGMYTPQSTLTGPTSSTMPTPVAQWKFNETTGNTAADSSGNGLTGTVTGSQAWLVGKLSNCFEFITGDNYITAADSSLLSGTSISVCFWFKSSYTPTDTFRIAKGNEYIVYFYTGNKPQIQVRDNTLGGTQQWVATGSANLADTTWHHIVATYNGTTGLFFIDGAQVTTTLVSSTGSFTQMRDTSYAFSQGSLASSAVYLDDLRVYTSALTLAQAQLLYNSGTGTETLTPTPAAGVGDWWQNLSGVDPIVRYGTADEGGDLIWKSNNTVGGATGETARLSRLGAWTWPKYTTAGVLVNSAAGAVTSQAGALPIANIPTAAVSGNSAVHVPTCAGVVTALASYAALAGATYTGDVTINAGTPSLTLTDTEAGTDATIYYGTTAGKVLYINSLKTAVGNVMSLSADGALTLQKYTTAGPLVVDASGNVTSGYIYQLAASDGSPTNAVSADAAGAVTIPGSLDVTGNVYGPVFTSHASAAHVVLRLRNAAKRVEIQDASSAVKFHVNASGDIASSGTIRSVGAITSASKPVMVWAGGTAALASPPADPAAGWVYLDTDNYTYVYTGSGWLQIGYTVAP